MKKMLFLISALFAAVLAASAQTTYVASTGNDGNTCNRGNPCRTLPVALAELPLSGGTIVALDSADYSQGSTLTLNRPVIIDGGEHGAFFTGGFYLSTGFQSSSTIRHMTILGGGITGTLVDSNLTLEYVTLDAFDGAGIGVIGSPGSVFDFKHVSVFGASTGISLGPITSTPNGPYFASLTDVTVRAVSQGVQITEGFATIRDSVIGYTNGTGISLTGPVTNPVSVIEHTELVGNTTGLLLGYGTVRLSNSLIAGNTTGIQTGSGTVISFRNNAFTGNGSDGSPVLSTSLK